MARRASRAGADYLAFGRFFSSRIKPEAVQAEPELLHRARQEFDLPLVAIGGINRDNVSEVITAGAESVAVISAILQAENTEEASRQIVNILEVHNE